jgi:hypothetical protein
MTTLTIYPNGQTLTSSALTVPQMNIIMQAWTLAAIGINPPTDFSRVRVDWPVEGQPFAQSPAQDVCFVQCVVHDDEYSRVRDQALTTIDTTLTELWAYTRGWRVAWCAYGPNAADNLRAVKSALFVSDYFTGMLALQNLFPLSDPHDPTYVPEQLNAQWWARADFSIDLYEAITESINDTTATSVEIKVYDGSPSDPVADVTVTA